MSDDVWALFGIAAVIAAGIVLYWEYAKYRCRSIQRQAAQVLADAQAVQRTSESLWAKIQSARGPTLAEMETLKAALEECADPFHFSWDQGMSADLFVTELNRRQRIAARALGRTMLGRDFVTKPTVVT